MIRFEQTFMNFLLEHQEKHNRTHHFLILMDAMISAAKHIQHYYLTGGLKGNLGLAGDVNVQGEDVVRMDQIAQEITAHYLKASGRVIHAISEEAAKKSCSKVQPMKDKEIDPWEITSTQLKEMQKVLNLIKNLERPKCSRAGKIKKALSQLALYVTGGMAVYFLAWVLGLIK